MAFTLKFAGYWVFEKKNPDRQETQLSTRRSIFWSVFFVRLKNKKLQKCLRIWHYLHVHVHCFKTRRSLYFYLRRKGTNSTQVNVVYFVQLSLLIQTSTTQETRTTVYQIYIECYTHTTKYLIILDPCV